MSGKKNRLSDLNDHLSAQIERLSQEDLTTEQIDTEVKRGNGIVAAADQILRHATLQVQAAKIMSDHGHDPASYLPKVEVNTLQLTAVRSLNGARSQ
jgi:hypothetical protein